MDNIQHIIKACLKKDQKAQRALYDLYIDRLYFTVLRYIKDAYYVENILQDVFLKIFSKLDTFNPKLASFNTWANTIAIRTSLNHLRKRKLEFVELNNDSFDLIQDLDPILANMEAEELMDLIGKIPEKYRVVFNLYEIDGFDHKEISTLLGITSSTSRSYLTRAKKLIQKEIGFCLN